MALLPFDDRDGVIWFDGRMIPWRDARIHVLTHGLHYASCVFEGERAYSGEIFKLTDHSERLVNSAAILDFKIPYSVAEIDAACREVVKAMKISDGYVRPVAWRGSEQMGVSGQQSTRSIWRSPPGSGRPISRRKPGSRASACRSPNGGARRPTPRRRRARRPAST